MQTFQRSRGQLYRWTDGHIILPLRGFDPVAYGRMRCAQLQDKRFDRQKAGQMTGHRYRHRHIISTGPHWGPLDSSVGKMHRSALPPH